MPTLDKDNKLTDIDPFTVVGLFNKGITRENRDSIVAAIDIIRERYMLLCL